MSTNDAPNALTRTLQERFKLTCAKCGSDNVVVSYSPEHHYSDVSVDAAVLSGGCNACQQNDFYEYV